MTDLSELNDRQKEAVQCTEGPLLVLAGAGSGKTKVLTYRIAYLIEEKGVAPYQIMAITFTNKAAEEMKHRVMNLCPYGDQVWVATFHATCVRFLRRYADRIGYDTDFTIYDADDQRTVVRNALKKLNLDPKKFKERAIVKFISDCKTEEVSPEEAMKLAQEYVQKKYAEVYAEYEKRLRENNAMDFDDLLLRTVELLHTSEEVLTHYQNRFRYIMVDEYQDTNHVQFEFVRLLSAGHHNLAVVGDDDQSIYKFRGADIRNILEFEQTFPGTRVVKLEQNYRSTTHILDCANAVIAHNQKRKEKHLWSALGEGRDVTFKEYETGEAEARDVMRTIKEECGRGDHTYGDVAILYRTNAQSRLFEDCCVNMNIPYQIVGGVNFYQREEIKDLISYLKAIAGGRDNVATERIINKPKRGIGDTSVSKALDYANTHGMSLLDAVRTPGMIPGLGSAAIKNFERFTALIDGIKEECGLQGAPEDRSSFAEMIRTILDKTEYFSYLSDEYDPDKCEVKQDNIQELINKAESFEDQFEEDRMPTLTDFLEEMALVSDIDALQETDDKVLLMTLHGSKGLEFPIVYLVGLEEGLFPSSMAISDEDPGAVEEERRLAYVGITRAMKELRLTRARSRMVNGDTQFRSLSRFVKEIPEELVGRPVQKNEDSSWGGGYGGKSYGGFGGKQFGGYGKNQFGSFGGKQFGGSDATQNRSNYGSASQSASFGGPRNAGTAVKPESAPTFGKTIEFKKAARLDYQVGDRVKSERFGEGTVLEIVDKEKDYQVTVEFDRSGQKKMMAGFAKLVKI